MRIFFEITEKEVEFLMNCTRLDKKYKFLGLKITAAADKASIRDESIDKLRLIRLTEKEKEFAWRLVTELNMTAEQIEIEIEHQKSKMKGLINDETALFIIVKERGLSL